MRLLDRITRPPVLTAFALLHAAALLVVLARYLFSIEGVLNASGRVVTGDFLAFYRAARMLAEGAGGCFYDLHAQRAAQHALAGVRLPFFQPYAYPPLSAIALQPLSLLPYAAAFRLHGLLMVTALSLALWALRPALPRLSGRRAWITLVLLLFFFHPVARTAVGGQNTALTLALVLLLVASVLRGAPLMAGVWLGLLSYKPQIGLPLLLVFAVRRELSTVGVAAGIWSLHYLLGAFYLGWRWPLDMLEMLLSYRQIEMQSNLFTHASLDALLEQLAPRPAGPVLGVLASLVALGAVLRRVATVPNSPGLWALALAATLLVSPHLQYYDVGLVSAVIILALEDALQRGRSPSTTARGLIAAAYVGYPLYIYGPALGFQPLALVVLLVFVWQWRASSR